MKSYRFSLLLVIAILITAAFAAVGWAQTKVTPNALGSAGAPGPKVYVVLPSGVVSLADLSGLVIDTSGAIPILKAVSATRSKVHVAKPLSTGPNLTLPESPIAGTLRLHRNGLLWTENEDYTITGNQVASINGQIFQAGDVLNAEYEY